MHGPPFCNCNVPRVTAHACVSHCACARAAESQHKRETTCDFNACYGKTIAFITITSVRMLCVGPNKDKGSLQSFGLTLKKQAVGPAKRLRRFCYRHWTGLGSVSTIKEVVRPPNRWKVFIFLTWHITKNNATNMVRRENLKHYKD
jgi:hypothetical protein